MSKGHSTTDALLYMLQAVYEAVDCGKASARLFFADFTTGFDLIDHAILMRELAKLEVHPVLLKWIATFLTNRRQVVRIGRTLKGGVPQGTKLGVIFFTVTTNKLLSDWLLRIKFVADTTALELIPRNSISFLSVFSMSLPASDIHNFAISLNMKLNPAKCKEMFINFLHISNSSLNPIVMGNNIIELVKNYKILGVIVNNELEWNNNVDFIVKKASKKLYSLRISCRPGVAQGNILKVYQSTVRPVLEYAVPVW